MSLFGTLFGTPSKSVSGFNAAPEYAQQGLSSNYATAAALPTSSFAPAPWNEYQTSALQALANPNPDANPYLQQVVNSTVQQLDTQGQGMLSDIGSQASNAGAFGGTRQALSESELRKNLLQQEGDTTANIYTNGQQSGLQQLLALLQGGTQLQTQQTAEQQAPQTQLTYLQGLLQPLLNSQKQTGATPGIIKTIGDAIGAAKG